MRYDNWHRESFDGCDLVGKSHHVVYIDFMCLFLLITIFDPEGLVIVLDEQSKISSGLLRYLNGQY